MNQEILSSFAAHHVGKSVFAWEDPAPLNNGDPAPECEVIAVRVTIDNNSITPDIIDVVAHYKLSLNGAEIDGWKEESEVFDTKEQALAYVLDTLEQKANTAAEVFRLYSILTGKQNGEDQQEQSFDEDDCSDIPVADNLPDEVPPAAPVETTAPAKQEASSAPASNTPSMPADEPTQLTAPAPSARTGRIKLPF